MEKTLQIMSIDTSIVQDQKELNLYVEKADKFKTELAQIDVVNDDNYEATKTLRADISASKTAVETARKAIKAPLLVLGKAIDTRATELSTPFSDMKDEVNAKIDLYEKAENDRKEKEADRVKDIIKSIWEFKTIEDLEKFYKALDQKDQRKKTVAEAGTLRKKEINEEIIEAEKKVISDKIAELNTVEELEKIDLGEFKDELGVLVSNKTNKIKLDTLEAEKKDRETKEKAIEKNTTEFIATLEEKTIEELDAYILPLDGNVDADKIKNWLSTKKMELENKKLKADAEDQKKKDKEKTDEAEKKKNDKDEADRKKQEEKDKEQENKLQEAEKTILDTIIKSLDAYTDVETFKKYADTVGEGINTEENKTTLRVAIWKKGTELEQVRIDKENEKNVEEAKKLIKDLETIFTNSKEKVTFENVDISYTKEKGFIIKWK